MTLPPSSKTLSINGLLAGTTLKYRFLPQSSKGSRCNFYRPPLFSSFYETLSFKIRHLRFLHSRQKLLASLFSSERTFSRLLTLYMQNPSVVGFNATANHCTITHITVLLIAPNALKAGDRDEIRFVKKFFPKSLVF